MHAILGSWTLHFLELHSVHRPSASKLNYSNSLSDPIMPLPRVVAITPQIQRFRCLLRRVAVLHVPPVERDVTNHEPSAKDGVMSHAMLSPSIAMIPVAVKLLKCPPRLSKRGVVDYCLFLSEFLRYVRQHLHHISSIKADDLEQQHLPLQLC